MGYFKELPYSSTPIPKVMWWYILKTNYKGTINAELCDKLLDGKLKIFFDKYPNQLSNGVELFLDGTTNISEDEASFFEEDLRGMIFMGLHSHSNKEVRKRKYAEQFAKTAQNKRRKAEKRANRLVKIAKKKGLVKSIDEVFHD